MGRKIGDQELEFCGLGPAAWSPELSKNHEKICIKHIDRGTGWIRY